MACGSWWDPDQKLWQFLTVMILSVVVAGYVIGMMLSRVSLPGELAAIEQLRSDAALVDLVTSEDVYGQVTQTNQKIARNKEQNNIWYLDLLVPDAWDDVQLIPISRKSER